LESPLDIDTEFIKDNETINYNTPRNGEPYSKLERDKRRQEVHKLHFEYGYSARKISELMKMNRNTINGDIDYWYSKVCKNNNIFNTDGAIILNIQRLEIQRTRLREQIDKAKSFQERLSLERLIYEIDCKILFVYNKVAESSKRLLDLNSQMLNKWMKENKKDERYLTLFDRISVSEKANERIAKIIKEDRMRSKF
jgi:hypothetical protein